MKLLLSLWKVCILLCILVTTNVWVQAQSFKEKTGTGLPAVGRGSSAVGDINNDGKLDIVIAGDVAASNVGTCQVFFGNGDGTFTESAFNNSTVRKLINLAAPAIELGDYDKDGNLDLLVTGWRNDTTATNKTITRLYRNSGPPSYQFVENTNVLGTNIPIPGANGGAAHFLDYNHDGFLDVFISGRFDNTPGYYVNNNASNFADVYRNNGNGSFSLIPRKGTGASQCNSVCIDYNNDGYTDIIQMSYPTINEFIKNNGDGTFTSLGRNGLPNKSNYGAYLGFVDVNNDGFLEGMYWACPTYLGSGGGYYQYSMSSAFALTSPTTQPTFSPSISATANAIGGTCVNRSLAWADYNNDGFQDVVVTSIAGPASALYQQTSSGVFSQVADFTLPGVRFGNAIWGDFNNDGRLDIFITGNSVTANVYTGVTKIFLNNVTLSKPQTKAQAPDGLTVTPSLGLATFTWLKTIDGETPYKGLTYNLRIGTVPGGTDVLNPELDPNGKLKIPTWGSIRAKTTDTTISYTVKSMAPGMYYCSVQAIDYGFLPGNWAPDVAFEIKDFTDMPTTQATMTSNPITSPSLTQATINWTNGDGNKVIVFMKEGNNILDRAIPVNDTAYTESSVFKSGSQIGSTEWYCVSNKAVTPNAKDSTIVTGLSLDKYYQCMVISYNGKYDKTIINYFTDASTGNPTLIDYKNVVIKSLTVSTNANGTNVSITPLQNINVAYACAVFMKLGNDANEDVPLVNGTSYTGNLAFGTVANKVGSSDWYCVYNGNSPYSSGRFNAFSAFTGLTLGSTYQVRACTYTTTGTVYSATAGVVFTANVPRPTVQANNLATFSVAYNTATLYWTKGNGLNRVLFMTSGVTPAPVLPDNTNYAIGAVVGEWTCIYNGNTTTANSAAGAWSITGATASNAFTSLASATTYQVAAYDYNGLPTGSLERYFSDPATGNPITFTTLPNAPVMAAPSKIDGTSFQANWSAMMAAFGTTAGYRLDVATDNAFTNFVPGFENINVFNVTGYSVVGLTPNTTYYYRVRAYDGTGVISQNSYTKSVYTAPAPVANDATDITANSFRGSWSAFSGASGYFLDVSTDPLFGTFTGTYNNKDISNVTSFTADTAVILPNTTYYYRVRGYLGTSASGKNGIGENSNVITVTTPIVPAPGITIAKEATNAVTASFTANWAATYRASGYFLDVAQDAAFTNFVGVYNHMDVGNVTSISVATNLGSPAYYYRVTAYSSGGVSAGSSNVITVTQTVPAAPTPLAATNIQQYGFDANWSASPTAYAYQVDVATDALASNVIQNIAVGNVTTVTVPQLGANTAYYYVVRAINAAGASVNSTIVPVTTFAVPAVMALAETNVTPTYFTANWTAEPTATSYRLDVATDAAFTQFVTNYNGLNVGSSTNFLVIGLHTESSPYYYRVRAVNDAGTSANSNTVHVYQFQTVAFDPLTAKTKTYGDADFTLAATASSTLPVDFTSSDPAVVSIVGDLATIHAAGLVNIVATQAGNANFAPESTTQPLAIKQVHLTVKAVHDSVVYGTVPTFKVTYSGFINGEDTTAFKGSPAISTVTLGALAGGGTTAIVISQGTLRSTNYAFDFVSDTLKVKSTGVKTLAKDDVRAYPNPTTGLVTIEVVDLTTGAYAAVYTDMGVLVKKVSLTSTTTQIDLSDVPSGAYLLKISGSKQTVKHILKY